jgi:hypothetical protein
VQILILCLQRHLSTGTGTARCDGVPSEPIEVAIEYVAKTHVVPGGQLSVPEATADGGVRLLEFRLIDGVGGQVGGGCLSCWPGARVSDTDMMSQ